MEQILFEPDLSPRQIFQLGVFGGSLFKPDDPDLLDSWVDVTVFSETGFDPALNCFGVPASTTLDLLQKWGWITPEDPLGWFQWYCRYFLGRRLPELDNLQICRWKKIGDKTRAKLLGMSAPDDVLSAPRQRQDLLQWAYDPFI